MKKSFTYLSTLSALILSTQLQADPIKVNIQSGLGFDSNPFRLSSSFSSPDEFYWFNNLELHTELNQSLSFKLGVRDMHYLDNKDASTQRLDGKISYQQKLTDCKCEMSASIAYRDYDKTYISRFTGERFAFGGGDASDRYDYRQILPALNFTYAASKQHNFSTQLTYVDREYQDYSALGLSNLDYQEYKLHSQWQYKPNKVSRYQFFAELQKRNYDQRLAVDASGDSIAGLISEYTYWKLGLKTRFKLASGQWLYANLNVRERTDNGGGYFDTGTTQGSLRYYARIADETTVNISVRFNDLDYSRGQLTENIENQDETPSYQGWTYQARVQSKLWEFDKLPLLGYVSINYQDISADLAAYIYDRTRIEAGFKIEF